MYTDRLRDDELHWHPQSQGEEGAGSAANMHMQTQMQTQTPAQSAPYPSPSHAVAVASSASASASASRSHRARAHTALHSQPAPPVPVDYGGTIGTAAADSSRSAALPSVASVLAPLAHARSRWLKPAELAALLSHARSSAFQWSACTAEGVQVSLPLLSTAPPQRPRPGSVYLYSKTRTPRWRRDAYQWIGTDRHNNLKLHGSDIITCYYAKCAESSSSTAAAAAGQVAAAAAALAIAGSPSVPDSSSGGGGDGSVGLTVGGESYLGSVGSFQRRGFCLIRDSDIMLVHYLDGCLKGAAAAAAVAAAASTECGANVSASKQHSNPNPNLNANAPPTVAIDLTHYLQYFLVEPAPPPPLLSSCLATPAKRRARTAPSTRSPAGLRGSNSSGNGGGPDSEGPQTQQPRLPHFPIDRSLQLRPLAAHGSSGLAVHEGSDTEYVGSPMHCDSSCGPTPTPSLLSSLLLPTASARAAATTTKPFHHASNPYSPGKEPVLLHGGFAHAHALARSSHAAHGRAPKSPSRSPSSASSPLHELLAIHSPSPTRESLYATQSSAPFHLQQQHREQQSQCAFDSAIHAAAHSSLSASGLALAPSPRRQLHFFPSSPRALQQHHQQTQTQQQMHVAASTPHPTQLSVLDYAPSSDTVDGGAKLLVCMSENPAHAPLPARLFCHFVRTIRSTGSGASHGEQEIIACVALERLGQSSSFRARIPAATHAGSNYAMYVSDSHRPPEAQGDGTGTGTGTGGAMWPSAVSQALPFEYCGRADDTRVEMLPMVPAGVRSRSRAQQRLSPPSTPSASRSPYPYPTRSFRLGAAAAAATVTTPPGSVGATATLGSSASVAGDEGQDQERELIVALLHRMQRVESAVVSTATAAAAPSLSSSSSSFPPLSSSCTLADLESCLIDSDSAGDDLVESLLVCSLHKLIQLDAQYNVRTPSAISFGAHGSAPDAPAAAARATSVMQCSSTLREAADQRDPLGRQMVHYAAGLGYTTLLSLLLSHLHADVNSQDARGRTPLHFAALSDAEGSGDVDDEYGAAGTPAALTVSALLSFGADDRLSDATGSTALALADRQGRRHVVQVFLDVQSAENMALAPEDEESPGVGSAAIRVARAANGSSGSALVGALSNSSVATAARIASSTAAASSKQHDTRSFHTGHNGDYDHGALGIPDQAQSDTDDRRHGGQSDPDARLADDDEDGTDEEDHDEDEEMLDLHEFDAPERAVDAALAAAAAAGAAASSSSPSAGAVAGAAGDGGGDGADGDVGVGVGVGSSSGVLLDRAFSSLTLGDMGIGARELAAFNVPDGSVRDLFSMSDTARFTNVVRRVQRQIRWWLFRRHAAAQKLQSVARGMLARRSIKRLRESALAIQSKFRTNKVRKEFIQLKRATKMLQTKFRERSHTGPQHAAGEQQQPQQAQPQQEQQQRDSASPSQHPHLLRPISMALDEAEVSSDPSRSDPGSVGPHDPDPQGVDSGADGSFKRARHSAPIHDRDRDRDHAERSPRAHVSQLLQPPALRPGEDRPPSAEPFHYSPASHPDPDSESLTAPSSFHGALLHSPQLAHAQRQQHGGVSPDPLAAMLLADGEGDADADPDASSFQPLQYDQTGLPLDATSEPARPQSDSHSHSISLVHAQIDPMLS